VLVVIELDRVVIDNLLVNRPSNRGPVDLIGGPLDGEQDSPSGLEPVHHNLNPGVILVIVQRKAHSRKPPVPAVTRRSNARSCSLISVRTISVISLLPTNTRT